MKGKIIVIEGTDGCGKNTQATLLAEALKKQGFDVKMQSFPNYDSPPAENIKGYLKGDLEEKEVNPYATSLLYTADRIFTMAKYQDFLENGGILVLDRYMESNFIHQGCKFKTEEEKIFYERSMRWIEYELAKIPKPDQIFFLNLPPHHSRKLIDGRKDYKSGEQTDIHEQNQAYLTHAYYTGLETAKRNNWKIIDCVDKGKIRSIEDIHSLIKKEISFIRPQQHEM